MYQNVNAAGNQYGVVSLNPAPNRTDGACMSNPRCAWADAMFVLTGPNDFNKRVAAPTFVGTGNAVGSTTLAGWWNTVEKAGFTPYTGLTIDKVGRTTGWTRGVVTQTCSAQTVGDAVTGITTVILCSDVVTSSAVGGGDSGAPVLIPPGSDPNVQAFGILFAGTTGGGTCTSNCTYLFSDWSAIETHLPRTFDYNTPGAGSVSISGPTTVRSGMTCHWTATATGIDNPQFTWSVTDGSGSHDVGYGADLFYAFQSPPAHQGLDVRVTNYQNQNASASKL